MRSEILLAALEYASWGWAVFPLNGKRPFPDTHGHLDASVEPKVIRKLFKAFPNANLGIACDSKNGPIVVDVDGPEGMISVLDLNLPRTREVTRGRKNRRHYYFNPIGEEIKRKIKVMPGLDILGDGGYVVAPPSIHPETGKLYRWRNDLDLAPFPKKLYRKLHTNGNKKSADPLPEFLGEGERDNLLTSLAGSMRRRGASERAIYAALSEENEKRCRPPLPDSQVRKIAKSIAQKTPVPAMENLTDLGNARRFIAQHQDVLRYVKVWSRSWMIWDDTRWVSDTTGEAERLAKSTVRGIHREANEIEDVEAREKLIKHAIKSEAASRIDGLLKLAATEPELVTSADSFDADPWSLNVRNGTLDLRTGELRPHKREDLITKMSPVRYNPKMKAPTWMTFLEDITNGHVELMEYLQRAVGYSLTGDVREQCLFFCFGSGQNGKSTFLEVVRDILGDYGQQAEFSTFLSKKGEGPRNDLARMRGTRLVSAVEAPGDKSFDESILKQLTGGDTITARRLYEEHFEFMPTHKIFLAANHKPHVHDQTEAFWRRIRLIPFTVYIAPEKRDRRLKEKLLKERSGILNWAIEGCLQWQNGGLGEPAIVQRATKKYRDDEDLIGEFIALQCVLHDDSWTPTSELYQAFSEWWKTTRGVHVRPPMPRWFNKAMGERNDISSKKKSRVRGWQGIALRMSV